MLGHLTACPSSIIIQTPAPPSLCDVGARCELTGVAAVRCSNAVVVVVQGFSVSGLLAGVSGGRTGHPWNDG